MCLRVIGGPISPPISTQSLPILLCHYAGISLALKHVFNSFVNSRLISTRSIYYYSIIQCASLKTCCYKRHILLRMHCFGFIHNVYCMFPVLYMTLTVLLVWTSLFQFYILELHNSSVRHQCTQTDSISCRSTNLTCYVHCVIILKQIYV